MNSDLCLVVTSGVVAIIGLLIGNAIGSDNSRRNILESCEKHGVYIIEGAAIQCPVVIKTK